MPDQTLVTEAQNRVLEIVQAAHEGHDLVVASPPGAGKTRLIIEIIAKVASDRRLGVIVNTNEQAHGLTRRLAATELDLRVTFAPGSNAAVPDDLRKIANLTISSDRQVIAASQVLICTAKKAAYLFNNPKRASKGLQTESPVTVDLLVVDEAWQLPWADLLRTNRRFDQIVLVGDPGQLDSFSPVALPASWHSSRTTPITAAPDALRASRVRLTTYKLPASWRLPPSAAKLVSSAFYPTLPFQAVSLSQDRQIGLPGNSAAADLWKQTTTAGFGLLELDDATPPRHDPELAAAIASSLDGLLACRPTVHDEHGTRNLRQRDIAVIAAHRNQLHTVRQALDAAGLADVAAHTANTAQGLEYEIVVVWHPLSGQQEASGFHTDAGRMCVMLSRHRQACLVVSRPGITDLLDRTALPEVFQPDGRPCPELAGWQANRQVLQALNPVR